MLLSESESSGTRNLGTPSMGPIYPDLMAVLWGMYGSVMEQGSAPPPTSPSQPNGLVMNGRNISEAWNELGYQLKPICMPHFQTHFFIYMVHV